MNKEEYKAGRCRKQDHMIDTTFHARCCGEYDAKETQAESTIQRYTHIYSINRSAETSELSRCVVEMLW